MSKEEKKEPLTIEQRIESIKQQGAKAEQTMIQNKELVMKCQGAIEVLEAMLNEEKK